ncbi:MAG: hypothetical protein NTV02_01475 [Candidatus Zambryskibacteria bacterium]|nr:hypothetical protein [Candidatus Zambryskibacteria bacterium]
MTKKTLKISAIVLILLVVALGAYYFLLSGDASVAGGKKPFFGNLFPFGDTPVVTEVPFSTSTPIIADVPLGAFEQKVRLISNEPIAGSIFIASTTGDIVRYIEKATGHVFDVPTYENKTTRISNTTIPQIYKAEFTESGAGFIAQYIKDTDSIETFYGKLTGEGVEKNIVGTILSRSIISFTVSPDGKNIFTLEGRVAGSEGYVSKPDGSNKKLIWSSPLKEFIPLFMSNTQVSLTSKPHSSSVGVMFRINTGTGSKDTLLSNELNLSTLPNTNQASVLYSNSTSLLNFNMLTGSATELSPKTFPEKCVWASTKSFVYCAVPKSNIGGGSLYSWYRGEVSYSDDIWEYDIVNNIAQKIIDLEDLAGRSIDISTISINKTDSLLLIESKIDGSLWTVKLD